MVVDNLPNPSGHPEKEGAKQARTGDSRRCMPDFRHQHCTTKAKKVNWEAASSKAGQKQLKLVSPKVAVKMKDTTVYDKKVNPDPSQQTVMCIIL